MKMLGYQTIICVDSPFSKYVDDVINAYMEDFKEDNNKIAQYSFDLMKQCGSFYSMMSNFINLGIIIGKRQERERRKVVTHENL